ncbi:MAG TPA: alpha/beta hydrolase [Anaerolineales bacterium]|nr:alpha/beta hydrolase [Anaerolineales bacterium]
METPSGQTYVRVSGLPTDPPLVLLHGARGNSLMWIPNIALLSAQYRTYALDTIGDIGLSVSQRKLSRLDDYMSWLDEVLSVLVSGDALSLVGMSYGGGLASEYALRFPNRLNKLVLLAPANMLPPSFALIFRGLLTLIPSTDFRKRFYYWLLRDMVERGENGRARVDEAVADWEVAERCFRSLATIPLPVIGDKALQSLRVPTLFLVGENEKIYSPQKAIQRLNRLASQIQTEIIPRAGHDLWIVQAEVVTKKILNFLGDSGTGNSIAVGRTA